MLIILFKHKVHLRSSLIIHLSLGHIETQSYTWWHKLKVITIQAKDINYLEFELMDLMSEKTCHDVRVHKNQCDSYWNYEYLLRKKGKSSTTFEVIQSGPK